EMLLLLLADVEAAYDIGMIQRGAGASLPVEAFDDGRVLGQGLGQYLDGEAVPVLVFAKVDGAHAARAEQVEDLVVAEREAEVFPLEEILSVKAGEQSIADQRVADGGGRAGQRAGIARRLQMGIEAAGVHHAALDDHAQKLIDIRWRWHRAFPDAVGQA